MASLLCGLPKQDAEISMRVSRREKTAMHSPKSKGPQGLTALGETISVVAAPMLGGSRGFAGTRVVSEWASIVGEHLAERSLPERVVRSSGGERGGTLHVRIAGGALAVELQHLEPLIIERINTYFGYQAVTRLKLKHGPLPELKRERSVRVLAPADEAVIDHLVLPIDDPDLRDALRDFGRSLLARTPSRIP
jgi:hypothetical protein